MPEDLAVTILINSRVGPAEFKSALHRTGGQELGILWKIHGCGAGAAWLPPALAERFAEIDRATWPAINPLTSDGGARYAAFLDWLGAHVPGEPCWLLDAVAVAPAAQGQGLGRTLVRHGVERARADGCHGSSIGSSHGGTAS